MKKVRITKQGWATRVFDAETNEELTHLAKVEIELTPGHATAVLSQVARVEELQLDDVEVTE